MARKTRLARRQLSGTVGQDERYWLLRLIAEDSFGKLWAGKDSFLDVPVTVRIPLETVSTDDRLVEELRRQLRAAYPALDHPNIAAVYYWNEGEDGPVQFVVMEPLPGETLAQRLRRGGVVGPTEAAGIAREIREGLESGHRLGISHGNLTPESVMLDEGSIKLLDFGVALVTALAADRAGRPEMMRSIGAVGEPAQGRDHDLRQLEMITQQMLGQGEPPSPSVPASAEPASQPSAEEWRGPPRGSKADGDPETSDGAATIGVTSSPTKEATEQEARRAEEAEETRRAEEAKETRRAEEARAEDARRAEQAQAEDARAEDARRAEVDRAEGARGGDPAWGAQVRPRQRWRRRVLIFALGILLGVSAAIVSEQLHDQPSQRWTPADQTTPSP
jgi:protein kinase-like protein